MLSEPFVCDQGQHVTTSGFVEALEKLLVQHHKVAERAEKARLAAQAATDTAKEAAKESVKTGQELQEIIQKMKDGDNVRTLLNPAMSLKMLVLTV